MDFTKSLMVIAVLAVVVSGFGLITTFDKIGELTGFAPSSEGNASLTVLKTASISFTNGMLNWSVGSVDTSCGQFAELTSIGRLQCSFDTGVPATTWDNVSRGLVIENDGSADVQLNLTSQYNATQFIGPLGATSNQPVYQWRPNMGIGEDANEVIGAPDGEANSCCPVLDGVACPSATGLVFVTWQDVAWEQPAPASAPTRICNNFTSGSKYANSNEIEVDVRLQVPSNAPAGGKLTLITASAKAL